MRTGLSHGDKLAASDGLGSAVIGPACVDLGGRFLGEELTYPGGKIRLFVERELDEEQSLHLGPGHTHYLVNVMRAKAGDGLRVFNGRDGEWSATVVSASKRGCELACGRRLRPQSAAPDLWLAFAPIKKTPADYVVQKATELGVSLLQPVITRRTIVSRVNSERMRANAIEASEQSGRLDVPATKDAISLEKLLHAWPNERRLVYCDEAGEGAPVAGALAALPDGPMAILTGPEGGFDAVERDRLRALPFVLPISLGRRILRADTAALAALAIWQSVRGDWR
jgi:16S rRNA (uracil1498-N3)-methyltransferase